MKDYLRDLNDKLIHGDATEHTHRPALQKLLEELSEMSEVSRGSVFTNEPKRIEVGAPDFVIRHKVGRTEHLPIGYIETKDVTTNLDIVERRVLTM
jgi:hypothetical protein